MFERPAPFWIRRSSVYNSLTVIFLSTNLKQQRHQVRPSEIKATARQRLRMSDIADECVCVVFSLAEIYLLTENTEEDQQHRKTEENEHKLTWLRRVPQSVRCVRGQKNVI